MVKARTKAWSPDQKPVLGDACHFVTLRGDCRAARVAGINIDDGTVNISYDEVGLKPPRTEFEFRVPYSLTRGSRSWHYATDD